VGSKKMILYDDVSQLEKIRVFDMRVERPPHYDTFAEFNYAYHYGDVHIPYLKQEEPLKTECQHFLESISQGTTPLTDGKQGLELVRILEASSQSLKSGGASVDLSGRANGNGWMPPAPEPAISISIAGIAEKKNARPTGRKPGINCSGVPPVSSGSNSSPQPGPRPRAKNVGLLASQMG
jgi:hypothetical protein